MIDAATGALELEDIAQTLATFAHP
jgi:hypothetical protein